jgi:peptidyl-prolyl cis-trans isomerase D
MFIAHGDKVRKHSRWILGGILILLIPGFIMLFTQTSGRERSEEDLPMMRGKPIHAAEYETARREVRDLYFISTGRELPNTPQMQDEVKREAVSRLLQLRKAQEVGVRASDAAVELWVRNHPIFRGENGQFDPNRYQRFLAMMINRGITEARFLELMRGDFVLGQLRNWVMAGAKVTPQEVQSSYGPLHERVTIDLVAFEMNDNKTPITVTDADAEAYFNAHKAAFRKPALVKVRYACFSFNELKKTSKVSDTDVTAYYDENRTRFPQVIVLATNIVAGATNVVSRVDSNALATVKLEIREMLGVLDARRRAAAAASELAVKLVPESGAARPNFTKTATAMNAIVKETDYFSQNDAVPGVSGRGFHETAFWLARRPEPPFSDAIEGPEGCYVLEYLDGKPARIPDFKEVKQQVVDQLKTERRYDATIEEGKTAREKIRPILAAGKTFSNACAELKLKCETYGPFTASDESFAAPGSTRIQQAVLGMQVGALSEFIGTATGGEFFHLRDRKPADGATFEAERAGITEQILNRNRRALYESWVQSLLREEKVDFGKPRAIVAPMPTPESEEDTAASQPAPAPAKN